MEEKYISRPFRETDLDNVITLRKAVVGRLVARKFERNWQWYFRQNPVLQKYSPSSWVVEEKGRSKDPIVGYISVVPGVLKIGNKKTNFIWGGDLMSHPGLRGKGIGKEMVKRWKEEANICLAFGVGDVAYAIESRMGWFNIDICKIMIKPLNPEKFLDYLLKTRTKMKTRAKKSFLRSTLRSILSGPFNLLFRAMFGAKRQGKYQKDYDVAEITSFDSMFDRFWDDVSRDFSIAVVRDSAYLNWKYTKNPGRKFRIFAVSEKRTKRIRGYAVLTKISSSNFNWGRVVEFVADPKDREAMQILITRIADHFEKEKCDGIQAYGMKKEHRKMFRRNGFIPLILKKQRFIVKIDKPEQDISFFKNPDNWFITAGDSDFSI